MANTVVGGAVVEITSDLAAFTAETKAGLAESLGSTQMRDTVTAGMTKAASQVGDAGKVAGAEFTAATAEAIKAGSPATTAAAEESATEVGAASKEKMATEGAESGAAFKDGMLDNLKGLASAAVPLLGIFAGGELVKGALEAADQLEGANIKIENVFGESGDSVKKWASGVATNLRMSALQAETAAGSFGGYLSGLGVGKTQAAGLSEQLVSLTANMAAYNNTDPATVQAALTSALKGRSTALKAFGVTLTTAQINQEALTHATQLGLTVTNGTVGPLNTQQKALATLYAVMDATKGQQGALAKTSDTLKAKQQILSAEFSNFMAMLGTYLLPVLAKLAGYILNDVVPALITAGRWIQQNQSWIKPLAEVVGLVVAAWIAWTLAVDAWQLVTKVATAVQAAFNAVMDANPIVLVVIALVALAAGFIYAYQHSATFRAIVQAALKDVKAAALDVANFFTKDIPAAFDKVTAFLRQWGPLILAVLLPFIGLPLLIAQHWGAITGFFSSLWGDIESIFTTAINAVVGFIEQWYPLILGVLTGGVLLIPLLIFKYWSQITGFVSSIFDDVINYLESLPGRIANLAGVMTLAGVTFIGGLWTGISNGFSSAASGAVDLAKTIFNDLIRFVNSDLIDPLKNFKFTISVAGFGHTFQPFGSIPDIPGLVAGGPVPGSGSSAIDSVPILAAPGEYMVNARGYAANRNLVHAINSGATVNPGAGGGGRPINLVQNIYQQPNQDPSSLAADSSRQIARSIRVAA